MYVRFRSLNIRDYVVVVATCSRCIGKQCHKKEEACAHYGKEGHRKERPRTFLAPGKESNAEKIRDSAYIQDDGGTMKVKSINVIKTEDTNLSAATPDKKVRHKSPSKSTKDWLRARLY